MLTDDELTRYARHITLRGIGGPGQQKLKAAKVLMIGAGGLGAPVLLYLAAAGVGTLGIVDHDTVSLSNLQRQILFDTAHIGTQKSQSAQTALHRLNPHICVNPHAQELTTDNAADLIAEYDIIIDGCDNFVTRYLVADTCHELRKPLISGAVNQFEGMITLFRSFESSADGTPNPTYRCLFPASPRPEARPACEETGVVGALTGIIGSLQAMETIKEIVGFGSGLVGRLIIYDARDARFIELRYDWDPNNPLNGNTATT